MAILDNPRSRQRAELIGEMSKVLSRLARLEMLLRPVSNQIANELQATHEFLDELYVFLSDEPE